MGDPDRDAEIVADESETRKRDRGARLALRVAEVLVYRAAVRITGRSSEIKPCSSPPRRASNRPRLIRSFVAK